MNNNVCSVGASQFAMLGGEVQRAFPALSDLDKTMTSHDWDDYVAGGIDDAWGFDWCPRHRSWFDGTWDECQEYGLVCPNPPPRKRWFNRTRLLLAA
jgi:hypothetical protein